MKNTTSKRDAAVERLAEIRHEKETLKQGDAPKAASLDREQTELVKKLAKADTPPAATPG